jgi:hypothetical protein
MARPVRVFVEGCSAMSADSLDALCAIIQEDVGNRGLRNDPKNNLITATIGDFQAACRSIADTSNAAVAVVTGFYIPHGHPPSGETDGPLGAVFLARAFTPLGIRVSLVSDAFCTPALNAGLNAVGLHEHVPVVTLPNAPETGVRSDEEYWSGFQAQSGELTHLLALERVGPSHTPATIGTQAGDDDETLALFQAEVPAETHGRCHSMRGRDITTQMSPAHRLFEEAARRSPRIATIGIGDGGNEIGMGKIPWQVIRRNIPNGGVVACRTPVDHLIVCGISNWGAYGLAAGIRLLRGAAPDAQLFDLDRERRLLQIMVERGPLVDGMSGEQTLTVDGFPFERYAEPLKRIAEIR